MRAQRGRSALEHVDEIAGVASEIQVAGISEEVMHYSTKITRGNREQTPMKSKSFQVVHGDQDAVAG
ncbi:hypothetical protein ACIRRA_22330 [Nocardia sp. NPDC101769]|uniref:hypothetical protein n=1 Tax=Nocardia sp. NPDC101769 TaxID=3364333 RepID=UPI00380B6129